MLTRMVGDCGFDEDIQPLFEQADRNCMQAFGIDLHDWQSVRNSRETILQRLRGDGGLPEMPPGGWPQDRIDLFAKWVEEGGPKRRGSAYAAFFADLDYRTVFFDVSGLPAGDNLMPIVDKYFGRAPMNLWWEYAETPESDADIKNEIFQDIVLGIDGTDAGASILTVEDYLRSLALAYFENHGALDTLALVDAFAEFGRDRLPADRDRLQRIENLNPNDQQGRLATAEFHRMDGSSMWFNWAGHLEMAAHLKGAADPDAAATTAMLAAVCAGSAMDFVFRNRARSKPSYVTGGEAAIWRQARRSLRGFDRARRESHELVQIFRGVGAVPPAMLMAARDAF